MLSRLRPNCRPEHHRVRVRSTGVAAMLLGVAIATTIPFAAHSARDLQSEPAPDFALKDTTGANQRLSEFRGDAVLLTFWNVRCGKCIDQLNKLVDLSAEFADSNVQVLSVNVDSANRKARSAINELRLSFPILLDEKKRVARLYELQKLPLTVLIDPTGTVRYVHAGYESGDARLYAAELGALIAE